MTTLPKLRLSSSVVRKATLVSMLVGLIGIHPAAVFAASFSVNVTTDEVDANLNDGICLTASGNCSLRAAVQQVNALGVPSTIYLQGGVTYQLTILGSADDATDGAHGDLDISVGTITIRTTNGRAIIAGGAGFNDRILDVHADGRLIVDSIQVSGGHSPTGAGIRNAGFLALTLVAVSGNTSTFGFGGGIYSTGELRAGFSTITGNTAGQQGGGIYSAGDPTVLSESTVSGNSSLQGGGIYACCAAGAMTIDRLTISGNSARDGAGIYNSAGLVLLNSTLSGNRASQNGGGLWNSGAATVQSATIAANTADNDADGTGDGGGLFFTSGSVHGANTVIGDNIDASASTKYPDCLGALSSDGYNLIENTAGCSITGVTTGNILGRDPNLGALQDNGGRIQTMALLPAVKFGSSPSPAIDAGAPVATKFVQCPDTDSRDLARADGNGDGLIRCDIGAYEYRPTNSTGTFALTPTDAEVRVGEKTSFALTWTVPTGGWRQLDTLQVRFVDPLNGSALWIRYHEVTGGAGTFAVVDAKTLRSRPGFAPGTAVRLESAVGALYLAGSTVVGPPGPVVTVTFDVAFKPIAAGRTFDIEVLATTDAGAIQGFARAGYLKVGR